MQQVESFHELEAYKSAFRIQHSIFLPTKHRNTERLN